MTDAEREDPPPSHIDPPALPKRVPDIAAATKATIRAQLGAVTDPRERAARWTDYLVAFHGADEAANFTELLGVVPPDLHDALRLRLEARRALTSHLKTGGKLSAWRRAADFISDDTTLYDPAEAIRSGLESRFAPRGPFESAAAIVRRTSLRNTLLAAVGAVLGFAGKAALDGGKALLSPANPVVVEVTGSRVSQFKPEEIRSQVAGLWISKFMTDNLPGLVGRSCYDSLLYAKDVPEACVQSWVNATAALSAAHLEERNRLEKIEHALAECAISGTLLPGTSPPSFRSTMDTTLFRPIPTTAKACEATRLQLLDYLALVDDVQSRLSKLAELVREGGQKNCRLIMVVQNVGATPWRPNVGSRAATEWRYEIGEHVESGVVTLTDDARASVRNGLGEHGSISMSLLTALQNEVSPVVIAPDGRRMKSPTTVTSCAR